MPETIETDFDREALVKFYSERHFEVDAGVDQIHYLPKNAPPREIRFLEVNHLVPEMNPPSPINFGVAIDGENVHTLRVLDVTPTQWDAIKNGGLPLPAGWSLEDGRVVGRRPPT